MTAQRTLKRLVVLVDGSDRQGDKKDTNHSSIQRLKQLAREGFCSTGRAIVQIPRYHVATGNATTLGQKFRRGASNDDTDELVKSIVKDVWSTLEEPEDELWLYGSGHGAFVARAVAGIVPRLGLPNKQSSHPFDDLYASACALVKAQLEDDFKHGPQLLQTIKSHAGPPPRIPFVGLFDSVKLTSSKTIYDISFNQSIETAWHALAMNETRSSRSPELLDLPSNAEMNNRSLVQAWFLGTSDDLQGGTARDGLSLYPLQWILLESIRAGLGVVAAEKQTGGEGPLSLVFPQYAGDLPNLDGSEDIEWRLGYSNGIQISMFDLQISHAKGGGEVHGMRLDPDRCSRPASRKIFGLDGLRGWNGQGPSGTIIHPSLFCILDRYPRYLELPSFRILKPKIASFQDTCLAEDESSVAPWLQGMQLQENGVKAFRILVCGKTGVGKSTLINKIFGVEMTNESLSYEQGEHDINIAFESPRHPGLLIHDSRGWQAGSDAELDLIAKFLRYRAFQQDPAEALHVIWFCVDADVSRIEEADKRTFATIAQFSHHVPVFVVGTKKDKLTGYRKMQLLEELMEKTNNYKEAKKLAEEKANKMADDQFSELRTQLSKLDNYKADGYCCLSRDDDSGVKDLLSQTLGLIADERVRLFCVAAQVVDVEQKINSAITECMRLGTHAIRTAAVPLPFSGMIGTPTVSRILVEHVLQCFGFPKATPAEIEKVMSDVVMGNLKNFMKVSLTQFAAVSAVAVGVAIPTMGIGAILGVAGCIWSLPPTARMLLKCSCDMILILERSFRYGGKYVSVKQIEDAAKYYSTTTIKAFSGKEKRLQQQVHDEIDQLIPLKKVSIGFKFNKLRSDVEQIIYQNRFGNPPDYDSLKSTSSTALVGSEKAELAELAELSAVQELSELPGDTAHLSAQTSGSERKEMGEEGTVELDSTESPRSLSDPLSGAGNPTNNVNPAATGTTSTTESSPDITGHAAELEVPPPELEGNGIAGGPREELETPVPVKSKSDRSGSRWWKLGRKSKTK